LSCDLTALERFVADVADLPLVAIGSGGSSTACHLATLLHRTRHRRPALFTTPLDVLSVPAGLHRAAVFLASASGKNKDVLAALRASITDEAPAVAVVTLRAENPLSEAAASYPRARVFAADAPAGKDGYLATKTVVVALVTPETTAIADSTLKLFPKSIRVVRLETALDGPDGTIDLLIQAFRLVDRIGVTRKQDPGRPHVPEFGRKLYRLTPPRVRPAVDAAIQRKLWASPGATDEGKAFQKGLKRFLAHACTTKIGAVAIDYDGTLCTKDDRFGGLRDDIVAECSRLLKAGLHLGIATGRGKSVREEFQKVLDRKLWARVHIGYYNGTAIGALGDDALPKTDEPSDPALKRAQSLLSDDGWLTTTAKITPRPHQLTVEPRGATRTDALAAHVMSRLAPLDGAGVRIVVSSHSLDVLGARPGKGSLVSWLREQIGEAREVLCIGDRGAWPGNDYALLAEPMSLSVDEVSSLDDTCWNLAPRGVSGPDATLLYLRAITARGGVGTFTWKEGSAR